MIEIQTALHDTISNRNRILLTRITYCIGDTLLTAEENWLSEEDKNQRNISILLSYVHLYKYQQNDLSDKLALEELAELFTLEVDWVNKTEIFDMFTLYDSDNLRITKLLDLINEWITLKEWILIIKNNIQF